MSKDSASIPTQQKEDRCLRGTWPWFALNVVLFPAPAHMTLLRVKEFSLTKSLIHLGITLSLFCVLIGSGLLQVIVPAGGKLWLLLPILSGLLILAANRSLVSAFNPFSLVAACRQHRRSLLIVLILLVVVHILPGLDLIAGNTNTANTFQSRFLPLPLWQEALALFTGTLLLLVGYVTNAFPSFTINRVIILYACFLLILSQLYWVLELAFRWLAITGGFGSMLTLILLAVILALDYYDAVSFGQYTRRYFLLTWTKAFSFLLLWLCFFGLPQKAASIYISYAYNQVKPLPEHISPRYLVFTDRDRFKSEHEAQRRIRLLQTQNFLQTEQEPHSLSWITAGCADDVLAPSSEVCRFQHLLNAQQLKPSLDIARTPFFRPVHREWDVMLSALMMQENLSVIALDQTIAGFKSSLPKASQGQLPHLQRAFDANYVALATGMMVDFTPPSFALIETMFAQKLSPVISLRLAGKDYWSALVQIDHQTHTVWVRMENTRKLEKTIQLLFDVHESEDRKTEILSTQLVALPLDYFKEMVNQNSTPVIVFSPDGLRKLMPEHFPPGSLQTIRTRVAELGRSHISGQKRPPADKPELYGDYSTYLHGITLLGNLLKPVELDAGTFLNPFTNPDIPKGKERLQQFKNILARIHPLKDTDRMDLAYQLVSNDLALVAPDLLVTLAGTPPVSSDLVDCRDAFIIGQWLFLLGHHQSALSYLKIAHNRHPFSSKYEIWYNLALIKMKLDSNLLYGMPTDEPTLRLYYQTLVDLDKGNTETALQRLETALEKDSHNSLINHLLHKYFHRPLDDTYFFPGQEGL